MTETSRKLILQRMPCSLNDLAELMQECQLIVPRTLNPYGRKRAIIEYADGEEAAQALQELQQLSEQLDKPLCVSSFGPKKGAPSKSTQTSRKGDTVSREQEQQEEISKYVRRLYACNNQCDFQQPPPPYLRYSYPPINKEILASIGQHLLENQRFYIQVLHLMNRMNLEPPFQKRASGLRALDGRRDVASQTEDVQSEPESELESDDEDARRAKRQRLQLPATREEAKEKSLKRNRQMLQQAASLGGAAKKDSPLVATTFAAPKINLRLPETLKASTSQSKTEPEPGPESEEKRLSISELQSLPVYKNYKTGEPSNKLYIKNLDKSVTEEQLRQLYSKYSSHLDIKVMHQGRMKGQAFVTFLEASMPGDVVAKALCETNGLIVSQKPMVVCYGRQQLSS
ncbi:hypothetical protein KR018_002981 [Drosophila ironensis]|nr:hypothetical protein KR018_002981 [Drosophila ironensis]